MLWSQQLYYNTMPDWTHFSWRLWSERLRRRSCFCGRECDGSCVNCRCVVVAGCELSLPSPIVVAVAVLLSLDVRSKSASVLTMALRPAHKSKDSMWRSSSTRVVDSWLLLRGSPQQRSQGSFFGGWKEDRRVAVHGLVSLLRHRCRWLAVWKT